MDSIWMAGWTDIYLSQKKILKSYYTERDTVLVYSIELNAIIEIWLWFQICDVI